MLQIYRHIGRSFILTFIIEISATQWKLKPFLDVIDPIALPVICLNVPLEKFVSQSQLLIVVLNMNAFVMHQPAL